jgi:MFS family permease
VQSRVLPLLVIGLGAALQPLDTSVNVAFPAITAAFDLKLQSIQWIAIAYVLTYATMVLVCGRLGDLFGYRLIFRLGLLISTVALILCALAETYPMLLAFRVLQGIGTALVMSCAPALTVALYPESERTRALSFYGMLYAAGIAGGPLIGGFAIEALGWQGVYWFRVPIALAALCASFVLAPGTRAALDRFDFSSALLLGFWMSTILLGLALLQAPGIPAGIALGLLGAGTLVLALFIRRERHSPNPTIRLSLFASARFSAINLLNIAIFLVGFAALLLVPYYLTRILALEVRAVGLVMTLWAAGSMLGAWAAGKLAVKSVSQHLLAFCYGWILCLGLALAALCGLDTGLMLIGAALLLQGIALGGFQVAYTDMVVAALRVEERGVAGSLAMLTRTLGTVGGATVLAAAYAILEAGALGAGYGPQPAFVIAFVYVFAGSAAVLAMLLLATMLVFRTAR